MYQVLNLLNCICFALTNHGLSTFGLVQLDATTHRVIAAAHCLRTSIKNLLLFRHSNGKIMGSVKMPKLVRKLF